ncbi:MAG: DNA polymerase III subunit delta [Verrucomicrobiia bacterium Tous-C5FEB]|nr:MAG: DNA polymerase III subunit delta [Verrucomicrobiae bacterium Tous-C5FEB]
MPAKAKAPAAKSIGLHAVIGSDEGMVREEALKLYNQLTGGSDDGFTHEVIDGIADNSDSAFDICSSVVQALQTIPMFGGDKVVWLRNANFFSDSVTGRSQRTESGVQNLQAALESGIPDGVRFLLTAQGIDKRRSFWKFIEKSAEVRIHDRIDTNRDDWQEQVASLVSGMARGLGLQFDGEALELFVMLAGEQSQQIRSELEKLDLFLGTQRRTVTTADVHQLVPLSREAAVFETGRAIQRGDAAHAIQLVDNLLEAEESAIGIMRASIINTVRNLFLARLIMDEFKAPATSYNAFTAALNRLPEIDRAWLPRKKDGSGVNVYPIFLAAEHARHFDIESLRHIMEATLKADQSLVTTGLDHRLILHRLIVEISAARKGAPKNR